jgi:hypothetical protein
MLRCFERMLACDGLRSPSLPLRNTVARSEYAGGDTLQLNGTTCPACPSSLVQGVGAPIFHVNGDDPEAVVRVCQLAVDWRQVTTAYAPCLFGFVASHCSWPNNALRLQCTVTVSSLG